MLSRGKLQARPFRLRQPSDGGVFPLSAQRAQRSAGRRISGGHQRGRADSSIMLA